MTKLELIQRQRRFEWELAREHQARSAASLVGSRTHDLLNAIQIIDLASRELGRRVTTALPDLDELVNDLVTAADTARALLRELLAITRPIVTITRGAPVGPAVLAAIEAMAMAVDVRIEAPPDVATGCTRDELEHLVIGLVLDVEAGPISLLVRERTIEGEPWLEIVRGTEVASTGDRDELRVVSALLERHGGELASSERRGGGFELIVALRVA